jgi:EAL domain-containing protein (putative c-di-GMP-specific phosphodiesterase class I)
MAHELGLKVIAEGIETHEQRDLLAKAKCDFGQGFFFSQAIPPEQMEALIYENEKRCLRRGR